MDYLSIILEGYLNENSRRHLDQYFYRKWKKTEKEHYTAIEFFEGCLYEIQKMENKILQQVESHKLQLENYIQMSLKAENIKIWKKELEEISHHWKTSYTISLLELTKQIDKLPKPKKPKINGGLSWEEIQFIKGKIEIAQERSTINPIYNMPDYTVPVWVLYYHYLQKSKKIPLFNQADSTKDKAIQKLLKENNHKFSWKSFRNTFYAIGNGKEKDPMTKNNLEKVIELLKDEPAKTIAKNDLYSMD